jgi:hypothetical protein
MAEKAPDMVVDIDEVIERAIPAITMPGRPPGRGSVELGNGGEAARILR